jgi:DNA-binding NarL/FixJ family response regulator
MSPAPDKAAPNTVALIADDHSLYRSGLSLLLKDQLGFAQVIEAASFDEALDRLADRPQITLALFDLSMPGMGGPASLAVVRASYPGARVAVVSGSEERENVVQAIAASLHGYIPKSLPETEIVKALTDIMNGRVFVPTLIATTKAPSSTGEKTGTSSKLHDPAATPPATLEGLTPRQRDVLGGIVRGLANKEIARELYIAEGTVKIHLAALFGHFDVRNRTELATRAQRMVAG